MVKKRRTRKIRQKGGAIPFLPPEIAPPCPKDCTGGQKIKMARDFFTNNNVYYITGHGSLLPNNTYKVPPKTYILHAGVSGKAVYTNTASCQGQNELKELVQETYFIDLWEYLTNQAGPRTGLYSRKVYEPEKDLLAIYAPGDIVSDMFFDFSNLGSTDKDITGCGIYKVPVNDSLLEEQERAIKKKTALWASIKEKGERNKKTEQEIKEAQELSIYPFINEVDTGFRNRSDNLLKDWFTRKVSADEERYTYTEEKIVKNKSLFPEKENGIRLFVVWACRSVSVPHGENALNEARRARARSINLHEYDTGVKETYEREQVERREKVRQEEEKRLKQEQLKKEKAQVERLQKAMKAKGLKKIEFTEFGKKLLQKIKNNNNRKTRRNNAIANADRVLLNDNYNVIKNLRNLLPQENKNILNLFNQTQKNQRKAKYDEIFKRLKNRLVAERNDELEAERKAKEDVEQREKRELENFLAGMTVDG